MYVDTYYMHIRGYICIITVFSLVIIVCIIIFIIQCLLVECIFACNVRVGSIFHVTFIMIRSEEEGGKPERMEIREYSQAPFVIRWRSANVMTATA